MQKYAELSEQEKAKCLLPIRLLQFPSIFETYCDERALKYFYQILPIPEDFYKSKIDGLGKAKVDLIKRSLDAVDLPLDIGLSLPVELDLQHEQSRLEAVQIKFLKSIFQRKIFSSIDAITDLPSELAANLDMIVNFPGARSSEIERNILLAYWGWDGQPPRTMEEVGALALSGKAVSRQRIEQSDNRARTRLSSLLPYTEHLQKAVTTLKELAPIHITDAPAILVDAGISLAPLRVDGLLNAAGILLGGSNLNIDRAFGVIFPDDNSHWFKNVLKTIGSTVDGNGVCNLARLSTFNELPAKHAAFIRIFIERSDSYVWVGDNQNWVYTKRKRNRVENTLQKIFSVTDSILPNVCAEQINKDPRIELELPSDILVELIGHFDFLEDRGGMLSRTHTINVPFGGAERAFLTQMTTNPEDFDSSKIEAYAASMTPPVTSPIQVLYRSPIARNIGYNQWVLIGDKWIDMGVSGTDDDNLPARQEAIDTCLDQMWKNAFGAVGQSGKIVESKRKIKLIGFTEEEFKLYCGELMRGQGFTCKLTSLPLDIYCQNRDYMPSADRIDSDIGYQKGNIQITCSFANKWKSNYNNDRFSSLLEAVKNA